MYLIFYLVAIVAANVMTASIPPVNLGLFIVPTGTFLIGLTFILRDLVQEYWGRKKTYLFILIALVLSGVFSVLNGDSLAVTYASALAFAISETSDTEIYSRLKLPFALRVMWSGLVGGIFDSAVFVILGLSPIGAGFLPWEAVPLAILGQVVVKSVLQLLGAAVLSIPPVRKILQQ
ncbi:VUT family protein [Paenibacillus tyrfis]|uniref:VUT family protein n=1 Tax=Paenibacillus tyrfis TaxID=1501230 RepID=UPI002492B6A0|nr:VUT family protein [Paenibacillus tyrfis]